MCIHPENSLRESWLAGQGVPVISLSAFPAPGTRVFYMGWGLGVNSGSAELCLVSDLLKSFDVPVDL